MTRLLAKYSRVRDYAAKGVCTQWPGAAENPRLSAAPVLVEDLHIIVIFFADNVT
jgi:hypothetical protein